MDVAEHGEALLLQPETDRETSALNRLQDIIDRSVSYRLPGPQWTMPKPSTSLDAGSQVLVVPDGVGAVPVKVEEER